MCGVVQESLQIVAIVIFLVRMRNGDELVSDVTLTEQEL